MNNGRHVRHESAVERKLDRIIELLEELNIQLGENMGEEE